jgi:ParB family chromosome partitioning protein
MHQTVPLSALVPPKANPRRSFDPGKIAELAASMAVDDVLQNLVVRCRRGNRYEVLAGERRFRALKLRQQRCEIDGDHPVPVDIRHGLTELEALRIATVENVQREKLDDIDEADAFAAMLAKGAGLEDIAAQTGIGVSTVKRRLALASLCDEAKAAAKAGDIGLAVAEALTLGSHDQQRHVLAGLESGEFWGEPDDVRAYLVADRPTVALAIFDLEQYRGTLTADLFGEAETTYFDDAEQFFDLQRQAVERLAADKAAQGAAFVEVVEGSHLNHWHYRPVEDGEAGGCVVLFTPSGRVEVRDGLVRNEEVRPEVISATREAAVPTPKARPEYSAPMLRYLSAHKTAAVQACLLSNPRKVLEIAAMQMLIGEQGLTLAPHSALATLAKGGTASRAYEVLEAEATRLLALLGCAPSADVGTSSPKAPDEDAEDDAAEDGSAAYVSPFRPTTPATAWGRLTRGSRDPGDLYTAVERLSDADLAALHALLVALSFGQRGEAVDDDEASPFNRTARDLDIDMRDWWRPDAMFLNGRTREQLEAVAVESGANRRMGRLKDYKKSGLVTALAKHFVRPEPQPGSDAALGRGWLPEAMSFGPDRPEPEPTPPCAQAQDPAPLAA